MSGAASKAVGPCECHCPVTSSQTVLVRLPAPVREYRRALAPAQNRPSRRHSRGPRMLTGAVALPAATLTGDGDRTFPFEKPDHRCHSMLGRHLDTHMHVLGCPITTKGVRICPWDQAFRNCHFISPLRCKPTGTGSHRTCVWEPGQSWAACTMNTGWRRRLCDIVFTDHRAR